MTIGYNRVLAPVFVHYATVLLDLAVPSDDRFLVLLDQQMSLHRLLQTTIIIGQLLDENDEE